MEPIVVPRPKSVRDPKRAASTLLLAQVRHLREAEKDLPPKYQSGIFHKAIESEGEAARYIQAVTEAIHAAHDEAAAQRVRPERVRAPKRKEVIEIAAAADERGKPAKSRGKKKSGKGRRKS